MIVVSNTSPVVNLAAVGYLHLLHQLYGAIIIPSAVYTEIAIHGKGQPGATEVQTLKWIETKTVLDYTLMTALRLDLDAGEAEAIALAIQVGAQLLLIDERQGRIVASQLGLKTIGILGTLVEAKHNDLIPAVKPVLDEIIARAGFWVRGSLYNRILETVGE